MSSSRRKLQLVSGVNSDVTDDLGLIDHNIETTKQMLERVNFFQQHLAKVCDVLTDYGLKSAGLGDKGAHFAECIARLQENGTNPTRVDLGLNVIPDLIASLGDHRDAEVKQIETKVVPILSRYGLTCKYLKNSIKDALNALEAEKASKKRANRLLYQFDDEADVLRSRRLEFRLEMAETEYEKNATISAKLLELAAEQLVQFEEARKVDLREFLLAFFRAELGMHAKSVAILRDAYGFLGRIDDLDVLDDSSVINTVFEADSGAGDKVGSKFGRNKSVSSTSRTRSAGEILSEGNFTRRSKASSKTELEGIPASSRRAALSSSKDTLPYGKSALGSKAAKPDKFRGTSTSRRMTSKFQEQQEQETDRGRRSGRGNRKPKPRPVTANASASTSASTFPASTNKDSRQPIPKTSYKTISKSRTVKSRSFPSFEMYDENGNWDDNDDAGASTSKATKPSRKVSFEVLSSTHSHRHGRTDTGTRHSCLWTETEAETNFREGSCIESFTEAEVTANRALPSESSAKTKSGCKATRSTKSSKSRSKISSKTKAKAKPAPRIQFAKIANVSPTVHDFGLDATFVRPKAAITAIKKLQPMPKPVKPAPAAPANGRKPQQLESESGSLQPRPQQSALYRRTQFL